MSRALPTATGAAGLAEKVMSNAAGQTELSAEQSSPFRPRRFRGAANKINLHPVPVRLRLKRKVYILYVKISSATRRARKKASMRVCLVRQARLIPLRKRVFKFLGKGGFQRWKTLPCKERFSTFGSALRALSAKSLDNEGRLRI